MVCWKQRLFRGPGCPPPGDFCTFCSPALKSFNPPPDSKGTEKTKRKRKRRPLKEAALKKKYFKNRARYKQKKKARRKIELEANAGKLAAELAERKAATAAQVTANLERGVRNRAEKKARAIARGGSIAQGGCSTRRSRNQRGGSGSSSRGRTRSDGRQGRRRRRSEGRGKAPSKESAKAGYAHNPSKDVPTSCSFTPRLTAECLGIYAGLMRLRRNLISSDLLALAMYNYRGVQRDIFGSN